MKKIGLLFFLLCGVTYSQVYKPYGTIIISEVYYDTPYTEDISAQTHHLGEFVEFFNSSNIDVDMSEWKLTDNKRKYYFPQGTIIPAGKTIVVTYAGSKQLNGYNVGSFFEMFPELDQSNSDNDVFYQANMVLYNDFDGLLLYNKRGVLVDKIVYKDNTFTVPQNYDYNYLPNSPHADYVSSIDNGKSLGGLVTAIPDDYKYSINIANVDGFYDVQASAVDYTLNPYDPRLDDLPTPEARQFQAEIATPHQIPFAVPLLDPSPKILNVEEMRLSNENFVVDIEYTHPETSTGNYDALHKRSTVTYFDELGETKQIVSVGQSPDFKDIFTHIEYDNKGRNLRDYLPTIGAKGNGSFNSDGRSLTENYYLQKFGQQNYFSENKFSHSNSSYIQEIGAPGNSWSVVPNVATNTYSNTGEYGKSFPFWVNTNGSSNYDQDKSSFDVQIIDDVLFINAKVVYTEPSPLTLNNTSKNINEWLGFNITSNHHLGFVQDGDLNESPYDVTIENNEIIIVNTGSPSYKSDEYVFNFSLVLSDHKVNSSNTFKKEFGVNDNAEVKYYYATSSSGYPNLMDGGFYEEGTLSKSITKDENWKASQQYINDNTTVEYKNNIDQVVLSITFDEDVPHRTYYIYDDFGNLAFVIPPGVNTSDGISEVELNGLCYQYRYDAKKRLIEKRLPGRGNWDKIVYDNLDRPILSQSPVLREQNKWFFTKYDKYGRAVYNGLFDSSSSRETLQNMVDNFSPALLSESRVSSSLVIDGIYLGYNNSAFPNDLSKIEIHSVNYYDDYNFNFEGIILPPKNAYNRSMSTSEKFVGLATGSKVRVLGTNSWIINIPFYRIKRNQDRIIYSVTKNEYLNSTEEISTAYSHDGLIFQTTTNHTKSSTSVKIEDTFIYDYARRLTHHFQSVDDQEYELIANNVYDELGEISEKYTGRADIKGYDQTPNISVSNGIITKTGGSGWQEGVATKASFYGDGYLEFITVENGKYFMAGLSEDNPNAHYSTIDYAIYIHSTGVYIYESGSSKGLRSTYKPKDIFRVERVGTTIQYKKNGEVFYTSTTPSNSETLLGDVSMYHTGAKIKNLKVVGSLKGLQKSDYTYNIRGWLTNINDDNDNDNDLFNFSIYYDSPTASEPVYNGNISQVNWSSKSQNPSGVPISSRYIYSYDGLNRIKAAVDNTSFFSVSNISYDKNGNIKSLRRSGVTNTSTNSLGYIDDLTYGYEDNSNKLKKVEDLYGHNGFSNGTNTTTEYTYDSNGNMITDANKKITAITYNHLNLPIKIVFNNQDYLFSTTPEVVEFVYSADGAKQRKIVWDSSTITEDTDYVGAFVYLNGALKFLGNPEGYAQKESSGAFTHIFRYKDQVQNTRLTYSDLNNDGVIDSSSEILQERNFYPFGLEHGGYNSAIIGQVNNISTFQDQEYTNDLKLNVHEWKYRISDPAIGRFWQVDPLSEDYPTWGGYTFSGNRLVDARELEGLEPHFVSEDLANNVAASLNLIFREKYKIDYDVFSVNVVVRDKPINITPKARFLNPFTWGNAFEDDVFIDKDITLNLDGSNFDWSKDDITKSIYEWHTTPGSGRLNIKEETSLTKKIVDHGGGYIENSFNLVLYNGSEPYFKDNGGKSGWTYGGVYLHENLYHLYPDDFGQGPNSPNYLRSYFDLKENTGILSRDHPKGDNLRPLEWWQNVRENNLNTLWITEGTFWQNAFKN